MSESISMKEKQAELFRRGILAPWKLHATQKDIYDKFHACTAKRFVINAGRRSGKSWLLVVMCLEYALKHPSSDIKYCTPTLRQTRKIILPLFRSILANCPKHLKPKYKTFDSTFEFPNGSVITVGGADGNNADALRGTSAHFSVVDEAGFVDSDLLTYIVQDILLPQSLLTGGRIILSSTPPTSGSHSFMKFVESSIAEGSYIKKSIYDNPMVSPEQIEDFKREAGGENSSTWRREYCCEFITDLNRSVVPEADDKLLEEVVYEVERPPFYNATTALDLGYVDGTGAVFGYYDFRLDKIIVEDEAFMARSTSDKIIEEVKRIEKVHWGDGKTPQRIVDGPALAIADLSEVHRFKCRAPDKADLAANINRVRMLLSDRRLIINPRCRILISQLKFAVWRDDTRKTFARDSNGYHFDILAALIYFCKHVDTTSNPFPAGHGYDPYTDFGYPRQNKTSAQSIMKRLFPFNRT